MFWYRLLCIKIQIILEMLVNSNLGSHYKWDSGLICLHSHSYFDVYYYCYLLNLCLIDVQKSIYFTSLFQFQMKFPEHTSYQYSDQSVLLLSIKQYLSIKKTWKKNKLVKLLCFDAILIEILKSSPFWLNNKDVYSDSPRKYNNV